MQIVSLFLTLGILIFVGLYLYAPFLERRARRVTAEEHEISALMAERERALNSLQELDFDFKLGKVPDEDYPAQRALLLQKGAEILRRLDELAPHKNQANDARIERAVAARRKKTASATKDISEDDLEAMISARRRGRKTKAAGFCPKCGKPVMAADKFCPSCGKALA